MKQLYLSLSILIFCSSFSDLNPNRNDCKVEPSTTVIINGCSTPETELFQFKTDCKLSYSKTLIYDRWGNIVFEEVNKNEGFDGTYKRDNLPYDTYFYRISYQIKSEKDTLSIQGYLQISS
jgi:gliding motility-associated-like protein